MNNKIFKSSLFFLGLYFVLYIVLGEDAVVTISDCLDAELSFRTTPLLNNTLFSFSSNDNLLMAEGIKRNYLNNGPFSIMNIYFYFLTPYWAYVLNFIVVKSIAFFGVFLICRDYVFKEAKIEYASLIALSYAFLGFYTICGIGVIGIPLFIWSFLSIKKKKHVIPSTMFILLFPFYSSLGYGTLYITIILFIIGAILFFKKDSFFLKFFIISLIYVINTGIAEIHLINTFLFKTEAFHRDTWKPSSLNTKEMLRKFLTLLKGGKASYHYPSTNTFINLAIFFVLFITKGKILKEKHFRYSIISIISIILIYVIFRYSGFVWIRETFSFMKIYSFNKILFYYSLPFYFLFALCIKHLHSTKYKFIIYPLLFLNFVLVIIENTELSDNFKNLIKPENHISYKEFYMKDMFDEAKADLGITLENISENKVGCLGIFTTVAQYNKLHTIGGYLNIYPLSYKLKFRKIIAKELEKNDKIKKCYDDWGSRIYLFSSEIGLYNSKIPPPKTLKDLNFSHNALKSVDCKYIFSKIEILNEGKSGLKFYKKYSSKINPSDLYVYKVN